MSIHLTINDILFALTHLVLVLCLFRGIYYQYAAGPTNRFIKKALHSIRHTRKKVVSLIEERTNRLKAHILTAYYHLRGIENYDQTLHVNSIIQEVNMGVPSVKVLRNDGLSWGHFVLGWTILTMFFTAIDSTYPPLERTNYSLAITLIDLCAATWLCFYSSWFTNKIIKIINKRIQTPY